ncbi:WDR92.2 family protein [Megaselia abdita]
MINKPAILEHIKHSVHYHVLDVKWVPETANVCVFGADKNEGIMELFEMTEGQLVLQKTVRRASPMKCGSFGLSHKKQAVTGDIRGRLQIIDLEAPTIPVINTQAHEAAINSIDVVGGDSTNGALEIVTGSKDGSLKVWDVRQSEYPVVHLSPESDSPIRNCWSVAFGGSKNDFERCVAAGFDNGDLRLFDLRALKVIHEDNLGQGICGLQFDNKIGSMNRLVASTVNDGLRIYDLSSASPEVLFKKNPESNSTIWTVQHLPQDQTKFATVEGNGNLRVWDHKSFKCESDIKLSSKPIVSFDWNSDFKGLGVVGSLDNIVRVVVVNKC